MYRAVRLEKRRKNRTVEAHTVQQKSRIKNTSETVKPRSTASEIIRLLSMRKNPVSQTRTKKKRDPGGPDDHIKGMENLTRVSKDDAGVQLHSQTPAEQMQAIQRKVGYEFQTSWNVVATSLLGKVLVGTPLTKDKALLQGEGWKLTNDGGEGEFVTDPIEEGEYRALRSIFNDMARTTGYFIGHRGDDSFALSALPNSTTLGNFATIRPDSGNADLSGKPQFTAGISLSNIIEVMSQLGDPESTAHEELSGRRHDEMASISEDLGRTTRHPEYQGFVALLASYVTFSSQLNAISDTVKNITSIMSRSDLALLYQLMRQNGGLPEEMSHASAAKRILVDVLALAAGATHKGNAPKVPISGDMRMIPPSTDEMTKAYHEVGDLDLVDFNSLRKGPTVAKWIADMVMVGKDRMSMKNLSSESLALGTRSMGTKGVEHIGPGGERQRQTGAIVEFRDFKGPIPAGNWWPWAEKLLEWITIMNDPEEIPRDLPEVNKSERERRARERKRRWQQQMVQFDRDLEEARRILDSLPDPREIYAEVLEKIRQLE